MSGCAGPSLEEPRITEVTVAEGAGCEEGSAQPAPDATRPHSGPRTAPGFTDSVLQTWKLRLRESKDSPLKAWPVAQRTASVMRGWPAVAPGSGS